MEEQKNRKKSRKKKKSLWIYNLLILIFLGIAAYSGWQIVSQLMEDKEGEAVYSNLIEQVAKPVVSEDEGVVEETTMVELEGSTYSVSLRQIDFEALWDINEDVVAWLQLEDTIIDYPVVQGKDNDYYLRRLLDGSKHRFGTLFVDAANTPGFSDPNTVIYGHNIKAGDMFSVLKNYREQEYYDEHPFFMLYTPDKTYRIELFAGCLIDGVDGVPMSFGSEEEYQEYIDQCYSKSTFESPIQMTTDDRMVTFYTCAYDFETARSVLHGKLVELESFDTVQE